MDKHYDLSVFRKVNCVERTTTPSQELFERLYLGGPGKPVILTDVATAWPALQKWNFAFFSRLLGEEMVCASDRLRQPTKSTRLLLSSFLRYCEFPGEQRFKKFNASPLYVGLQPFAAHPELLADFSQPAVAECIYQSLRGELHDWYVDQFGVILIGSAGTVTPLHQDLYGTHSWLAQIRGRKRWLIFSPDSKYLYNGQVGLLEPNVETSPDFKEAEPFEAVVTPGEVIFIPRGWHHEVTSLDPSISLTFNFVNSTNYLEHVLGICADLPKWAKRINSAGFRRELSISWNAADFAGLPPLLSEERG